MMRLILGSFLVFSVAEGISPECKGYLTSVARSNSEFEVCALIRARPFAVCTECFDAYANAYNTFVKLKDGKGAIEKNCSEDLTAGDRVSIINQDFDHLTKTWASGFCETCLITTKTGDTVSFKVSNSTLKFQAMAESVRQCIDTKLANKSLICDACSEHFRNLSEYYYELGKDFKNQMCMDIVDNMNATRVEWSTYGCSKVYEISIEVWVYAATMVVLTILFYITARLSQSPRDSEIIEGRTLRDRMIKIFHTRDSGSINSDSREFSTDVEFPSRH